MIQKLLILLLTILIISCAGGSEKAAPVTTENDSAGSDSSARIELTDRPPNFETPLRYFKLDFTPNDIFFVRWHLAGLPSSVDEKEFHLHVTGHVRRQLSLSLADLKTKFKPVTFAAVVACAGNARSFADPRVPGVQWKNGGMGNAMWKGVRLKDILDSAGCKQNAFDVAFNGMDEPPLPGVPDFVKSLRMAHALDGEVMVAYEMNGKPLPLLNGYPLKLVVPGWYATYWVGMLNEIKVFPDTFKGYWMEKAYRIPDHVRNGNERPDSLAQKTEPINKLDIRSVFVSPEPGTSVPQGKSCELEGLAFDGGDSIVKVEISGDGKQWQGAQLSRYLGKYSWRRWKFAWTPSQPGTYTFYVKATNALGETQPDRQWNRSGYMRNQVETLELNVH